MRSFFASPPRLDSLTGLRVPAAVIVFAHHAAAFTAAPQWMVWVTTSGPVALSFFFILSGFVLAWTTRRGDGPLGFWRRRAARILPLYWSFFAVGAVYGIVIDADTAVALVPSLLLVQAWFPDGGVHFAGNSVGWSLSAEVFFYAAFPVILTVVRRLSVRSLWAVLAGALVLAVVVPVAMNPTSYAGDAYWRAYVLPASRLPEFVSGIALALLMRSGFRVPVPVPVAVAGMMVMLLVVNGLPIAWHLSAATAVPLLVLVGAAAEADRSGRGSVFARRWLVRTGNWTFAFYLAHLLVLRVVSAVSERSVPMSWWQISIVAFAVTVAVAAVAAERFEQPLERRLRGAGSAALTH